MLIFTLVVLSAAPLLTPVEKGAEKQITESQLRAHVRFLASDTLEGRGPATPGDRLAQEYIATQFESLGLTPGVADGGWYQPFDLVGVDGAPDTLTFSAAGKPSLTLKRSDDFIAVSGHQAKESILDDAELVFAGYGIVAPEYGWNDFKTSVKGKVIVVMNNDPERDPALFAGKTRLYYGRWGYKYEQAARAGAVGCIIIHTTPSAGYPWQVVQTSWAGEQFDLPAGDEPTLQVKAWTTEDAMRKLVALSGKSLDTLREAAESKGFTPVPLGVKVKTRFANAVVVKRTANVLGVLPGSDPTLKGEYVVVTAHHDHLGRKAGVKPGEDEIYNGAVDNASGVAALLSVARALTSLPKAPKRSVLFAAVAAEEQGLLGSAYFVSSAPVPVAKMIANVNIDGVNIWGRTADLSVVGLGKSSIDAVITQLAKAQGRTVKPDALADRGFFYRSDQFNFAKKGVPSAYFSSGHDFIGRPEGWGKQQRELWEATRYHQPSDELTPEWDLSGAVEDVRLYYGLAVSLANTAEAPTWTKGDEFEAERLTSKQK
ncbi:MAG: M28 family peptidase [Archangium sp.]|nr:M28 family peptidase [Archangium sp.]